MEGPLDGLVELGIVEDDGRLFPPNSSVTSFGLLSADALRILRPVGVLPVNATLWIPECSLIAWPTVYPCQFVNAEAVRDVGGSWHTISVDDVDDPGRESCFVDESRAVRGVITDG